MNKLSRRTFLKQAGLGTAWLGLIPLLPGCRTTRATAGSNKLPRSAPEAEGVSSASVVAFLDAVAQSKHELHSFIFVRHGRVIAEGWWSPYGPQYNHTLYSLSKSFTSTGVGFAVAEGKLRVDDRVVTFFGEDLPDPVSERLSALRVRDLLTMSAGHGKEPTSEMVKQENWVRTFLAWPMANEPGSTFLYNSGATYMLSAIVQKTTGQKLIDYLTPRLFEPLGIEGETWETCPRGINVGGWGLSVQTETLAKFGQLYLQQGRWQGRQLLPSEWVNEATTFKIQQPAPSNPTRPNAENDWLQGYCYQFWRCRHDAFRGDGAFGQFMVVIPHQDAVVAITAETGNMPGELDLVWNHLLPAMKNRPLPSDRTSQARLNERLASLELAPPKTQTPPARAAGLSERVFKLENNDLGLDSVSFTFQPADCIVTFQGKEGVYPIACGYEKWRRGETALTGTPPRLVSGGAPKSGTKSKIAASAAWKNSDTFEIVLRYYETPHHDTVTCRFDGDEKMQVSFMSSIVQMSPSPKDSRPTLDGKMT
jgi:CubicO group peptidase (beta-lactamase class C family)